MGHATTVSAPAVRRREEALRNIVDAEHLRQYCFSHLVTLTRNGRIRDRFAQMSAAAGVNLDILRRLCGALAVSCAVPRESCRYCRVKPESFSLVGAINIGFEVTRYLIGVYKELIALLDSPGDRRILREVVEEISLQKNFLRAERKFVVDKQTQEDPTYMESYCMPQILSRLSA